MMGPFFKKRKSQYDNPRTLLSRGKEEGGGGGEDPPPSFPSIVLYVDLILLSFSPYSLSPSTRISSIPRGEGERLLR